MSVLDCYELGDDNWSFYVLNATGERIYTVYIAETPTCTCEDFLQRNDLCKHMMYVTLRILGLPRNDERTYRRSYSPSELAEISSIIRSMSSTT
jgi:hypothetical protein